MGGTLTRSESPRLLGELVVNSFVTIFCDPNHRHKIPTHAKLSFVVATAAASLRSLTKKDTSFLTRSNLGKRRRRSPVPQFLPSPLLKPRDRDRDVGYVNIGVKPLASITGRGSHPVDRRLTNRRVFILGHPPAYKAVTWHYLTANCCASWNS